MRPLRAASKSGGSGQEAGEKELCRRPSPGDGSGEAALGAGLSGTVERSIQGQRMEVKDSRRCQGKGSHSAAGEGLEWHAHNCHFIIIISLRSRAVCSGIAVVSGYPIFFRCSLIDFLFYI